MSGLDEHYIKRTLQLAELGRGYVSPNPMVGCVIVHKDNIIGEGFHQKYGGPHAEVNAINSVRKPELLPESTVYVSLEPCSHFGNTPPCSDLLIEKKVKKVVVAAGDPNPQVNGRGIQRMRDAGIEVITGVLEEKSKQLNVRFNTFFTKKRPYIILKWAQTADGFIAREDYDSKWISNAYSRQMVHRWRAEEDSILVGRNTAFYDNPNLTTRDWVGKNPIRLVIDLDNSLQNDLKIFNQEVETLIFTKNDSLKKDKIEWIAIGDKNVEENILKELYNRKIQSVIIEGGTKTLQGFMKKKLWDEARVFSSNQKFGRGVPAPELISEPFYTQDVLNDNLTVYKK